VSTLVGLYVVFLAIGAFTLPLTSRLVGPRNALVLSAVLVALGYALWLPFHDSTGQALLNMAVAGLGSGALVAALPATAAAAAPPERTGFATGMTNATKTVGGAIASSIFAISLASTGSIADPTEGHAPLSGYLTVWDDLRGRRAAGRAGPADPPEAGHRAPRPCHGVLTSGAGAPRGVSAGLKGRRRRGSHSPGPSRRPTA
jgi:MFS family permease